jgi:hypothetical protein
MDGAKASNALCIKNRVCLLPSHGKHLSECGVMLVKVVSIHSGHKRVGFLKVEVEIEGLQHSGDATIRDAILHGTLAIAPKPLEVQA